MIWLVLLCGLGVPAGFLLLTRVPRCRSFAESADSGVSIVIPARNEEATLPILLPSIVSQAIRGTELIVVDDGSTDATAAIAAANGARVLQARALPTGWTGKTWACFQGAEAASEPWLLFLDADTWFEREGLARMLDQRARAETAVSILPYHVTRKAYEELSLFFNLLMAFGAGGFGAIGKARLFGQSLLISRKLYESSGGHAAVRGTILENLAMAHGIEQAGGKTECYGGRGILNLRMFPAGFRQLCEGWTKAFADGAAASDGRVLGVSIFWLSALSSAFLMLFLGGEEWRWTFAALYACFCAQVFWLARQIGTFRALTCVFYPVPLAFFFALFTRSLLRRLLKRNVTWRGRTL